jgi:hypothetical protein
VPVARKAGKDYQPCSVTIHLMKLFDASKIEDLYWKMENVIENIFKMTD